MMLFFRRHRFTAAGATSYVACLLIAVTLPLAAPAAFVVASSVSVIAVTLEVHHVHDR